MKKPSVVTTYSTPFASRAIAKQYLYDDTKLTSENKTSNPNNKFQLNRVAPSQYSGKKIC